MYLDWQEVSKYEVLLDMLPREALPTVTKQLNKKSIGPGTATKF